VADTVVRMVRDARDALEEPVEVLVVDDDTSYLSAPFVLRLRDRGVVTVGIYDPDEADGHGYRYLLSVGVDLALPSTLPPEELLDALSELRPERMTQDRFRDVAAELDDRIEPDRRRVIGVSGPAGSGGTEIAVGLAHAFSSQGATVLVDLDDSRPAIARRLGLSLHPHVVTAIETLRRERVDVSGAVPTSLEECLARPVVGGRPPFAVLAGLAAREDWGLLRADDASDLLEELAARYGTVVARLGPDLEDLGRWVPRYEVGRRCLAQCSRAVAVCEASPLGVLRFLDWLTDAIDLAPGGAVDVVLNKASRSPDQRDQLVRQLTEVGGDRVRSIAVVPRDRRVERAAWDAEVVGRGPFERSIRRLALQLTEVAT
jgi:CO dehydrogenase nickel-insertion accessory protein CooC1